MQHRHTCVAAIATQWALITCLTSISKFTLGKIPFATGMLILGARTKEGQPVDRRFLHENDEERTSAATTVAYFFP